MNDIVSPPVSANPAAPAGLLGRVIRGAALLLVIGLVALLAWGVVKGANGPRDTGEAPNFSLTSFDGQTLALSDLRGKLIVINFWASWCQPCRQEAAYLEQTWRKYQSQGVVFIGVDWVDTDKEARAYLSEFGITYFNGPDLGTRIAQDYRIQGVPETFFIDRQGRLQGVHIGPFQAPELDDKIDALLRQP